jgi:chemotaxis protein CheZ
LHAITTNQKLIGLVNRNGVWIHHVANSAPFCPVAFIFDERGVAMVNRWCAFCFCTRSTRWKSFRRELHVKSHLLKKTKIAVRKILMPIHRRRFRVEQAATGDVPMPVIADEEVGPMHREIMNELRAIRSQMAAPAAAPGSSSGASQQIGVSVDREVAEAQAMLETYRAQIEQCEKLKVELDLIYDAINRTKREIAVLHGKSFSGEEMARVNGELGAVVGGTEEATQQILEAAEIQEKVVSIFEACNFQDLTGQRIKKVMTTMKFIENHITVMMDIWGGVDAIKAHAPPIVDTREGDAKLLNGPKLDDDVGHASQDDIDALFD